MSKFINEFVSNFENETPTLLNQHNRVSFIGLLPIQVNSSVNKDTEGKTTYWAQLLCNFTASYQRTDETGQTFDDNKSLKTLVVKFPMSYLEKYQISTQKFKNFFDEEFVAQKFIILPVSEEKQSYQYVNDKRLPIKNQTEVVISDSFDLSAFMASFTLASKK